MKSKNKTSKSGPSNLQLIWNIFSWAGHFHGKVRVGSLNGDKKTVYFETNNCFYFFSLLKKSELLAANCILTWWANMGLECNYNGHSEYIFDFDLTKKKNRDKFKKKNRDKFTA